MNPMNEALRKLEALFSNAAAVPPRFPPNSRYNGLAPRKLTLPNGQEIAYLARRFIPPPESLALAREHAVVQGDRLDLLAARYLGDPEQWWKIADANLTLRPEELVDTPARTLRIALPVGFVAPSGLP